MTSTNPTSVRELRASVVNNLSNATPNPGAVELRFPQKLRAAAAGEVFAQCRPHFTEGDEDDLGYILGQLAGWVIHGNAYDPDLDEDMIENLKAV